MKLESLLMVLLSALAASCTNVDGGGTAASGGGKVEVDFQEPDLFSDMGRSYTAAHGADRGYIDILREHFQRAGANRVPEGYALSVTIMDVDMAGHFEPERGPEFADIRMVRSIYPPRIKLKYRLTDSTGAVRSEGDRRLSNQNFELDRTPVNYDDPMVYEKALVDDFLSEIAQIAQEAK